MNEIDTHWLAAHPLPHPGEDTDKNKRGRVLVTGGALQVPAALRLAGEAAFRAGAGKVQLATVEPAALGLGLSIAEAAVFALPDNADGELAGDAGAALVELIGRCDALVLGPGMGANADAEAILRTVLGHPAEPVALLLDAAMLAVAPGLDEAIRGYPGPIVLTPHPGEMAALMERGEVEISPDLARAAADRFGATVVLKGPETFVAGPDGLLLHFPGGGPGLATGGSGDVLAGTIGGLLARGAEPGVAAAWGVWLHGEAGRRLAREIGPLGFMARELLPLIPSLMAEAGPDDRARDHT